MSVTVCSHDNEFFNLLSNLNSFSIAFNIHNCEHVFSSKTLPDSIPEYIVNCDLLHACKRSQFTIYWYTDSVLLENTFSQFIKFI